MNYDPYQPEYMDEDDRGMREYWESPVKVDPSPPVITYLLIGINVIMWLLEMFLGGSENIQVLIRMGAKENSLIAAGQYWRLLTPVFLHAGVDHLLFNSFGLLMWGRYIEALFGKGKYLFIYLVSGLVGSLASYLFSPAVSVGASGAIFGLFGTLLYFRKSRRRLFHQIFGVQVIVIIVLNLFNGFTRPGIDNWGHIGGLIGGYLAASSVGLLGDRKIHWQKMMAWGILLLAFYLGLPYGQIKYQGEQDKRLAYRYYEAGDYGKAEKYGLRAKTKKPQDRELDLFLSEVYFRQGARAYDAKDWEKAEAAIEKSIQYEQKNSRAHLVKAFILIERQDFASAEEAAREAIRWGKDGNSGYAYYVLGYTQYHQGDIREARESLAHSIELDPSLEEAREFLKLLEQTQ
jgi:rhomboid protease GluP